MEVVVSASHAAPATPSSPHYSPGPMWVPPTGCNLQEQSAAAWVPHGVIISASKPAPA